MIPVKSLSRIFQHKMINLSRSSTGTVTSDYNTMSTDILIMGGGIVGCSAAYWLKRENPKVDVVLVERDTSYAVSSTVRSVGGIRQQFSEPENIQMSLFVGEMLSNLNKYFSVGDEDEALDIQFIKRGYLIMSGTSCAPVLQQNFELQKRLGANVAMMSKDEISSKYPWLNVSDIECGVHGYGNEGWFDPWLLLNCIRRKISQMGVRFVNGDIQRLFGDRNKLNGCQIVTPDKKTVDVKYSNAVNATGAWADEMVGKAQIACGLSREAYPIFVTPRKRYVYTLSCPDFPKNGNVPMVIDNNEIYFRREETQNFICGLSPKEEEEPDTSNLDVDYVWFEEVIWPLLYHRVPSMAAVKVKSGWAGFYDYNTKDQNLIIGLHPAIGNFYLCNGSSGHGIQHALAIGRAIMELIYHGRFMTIDLTRFSYQRMITGALVFEKNIF